MLEYVALVLLLLSITAIFYIFIYIHDIPHSIAKKRHHPQEEVIHYACWLSLFTLHAIWPIVFLWAVSNRKAIRVSIEKSDEVDAAKTDLLGTSTIGDDTAALKSEIADLKQQIAVLEQKARGNSKKKGG